SPAQPRLGKAKSGEPTEPFCGVLEQINREKKANGDSFSALNGELRDMLRPAPGIVGAIRRYNEAHPDNTYPNDYWTSLSVASYLNNSDNPTFHGLGFLSRIETVASNLFSPSDSLSISATELWATASAYGCPNLDQYRPTVDIKAEPTPPTAQR
ncbi:MAG: hypothetical protein QE263_04090, partial [Vampirovibrionales bacterium]|nr:hypothetical protein [Vampirovibrionales bacterium]